MSRATVAALQSYFDAYRSDDQAGDMARYMRDQFPFLGIKTPQRRQLLRAFLKEHPVPAGTLRSVVRQLWDLPQREYQYVGLDLLDMMLKTYRQDDIFLCQHLLTHKAWWDTVDWIASRHVGGYAKTYPGQESMAVLERWISGDIMWLRRSAIIFQLRYKDETDEELLFDFIRRSMGSEEFFIQKAMGWALREYSKTSPEPVIQFVEHHDLPALSRREALKAVT